MNLKLFENIKKDSEQIVTVKNILKYSLHLQYGLKQHDKLKLYLKSGEVNEFIEEIANQAWDICKPLFLGCITQWNFFGIEALADENDRSFARIIYQIYDFWPNTIKNQSIVSTLFTLRSEFGKEKVSAYQFESYLMNGGFSSIKKYFETDGTWKQYKNCEEFSGGCGYGPNLIRKFNTFASKIKGSLKGYYESNLEENGCKIYRFPIWSADFINFLLNNDNKKRVLDIEKRAFCKNEICPLIKYVTDISYLEDALKEETEEFNIVDSIMLQYIVERNFNYLAVREWIFLLLSKSKDLKEEAASLKENPVDIKEILPIDIMLLIFELPNVFSRKYYMRYIIDAFEISHCENTYFSQHDNPQRSAGNHIGKKYELLPRQAEWIKSCKSFLLFMIEMVFPICERCFFLLYQDAIISTGNEGKWFSIGLEILEKYVEDNANDIQKGGFPEEEYKETIKSFGKKIGISLDELLSDNNNFSSYSMLERSEKLAYDLLIKKIISNLPPIDNEPRNNKWEDDYFRIRQEDNKEHYAKLFDCYMKSMGIK